MFAKIVSRHPGIGVILSSSLLSLCATGAVIFSAQRFNVAQRYPDFIVGQIAWSASNKSWDYLAVITFVTTFILTALLLQIITITLDKNCEGASVAAAFDNILMSCLIPAAFWLGSGLVSFQWNFWLLAVSCLAVLLAIISGAILTRYRQRLSPLDLSDLLGAILFSVITGFMAILALLTFAGRASLALHRQITSLAGHQAITTSATWLVLSGGLALLVPLISAMLFSETVEKLRIRVYRIILFLQLPIPLLWLVMIPPPWRENGNIFHGYPSSPYLVAAVWLIVALSTIAWLKNLKTYYIETPAGHLGKVITIWSLIAIIVLLKTNALGLPVYSGDDYHLGERLLPWQQFMNHGKQPFVDINYPRGTAYWLNGLINWLFFDGSAPSLIIAGRILSTLSLVTTLVLLSKFLHPFLSLIIALASPSFDEHYQFIFPAIMLLISPYLRNRPNIWLPVWVVICLFMVFFMMSTGTAFAIASIPIAFLVLRSSWQAGARSLYYSIGATIAVLILLGIFTPLAQITSGMLSFLKENATVNTVANGASWISTIFQNNTQDGVVRSALLMEMVRFGWIVTIPFLSYYLCKGLIQKKEEDKAGHDTVLLAIIFSLAFLVAITAYSFGRIDPEITRTAHLSLWFLGGMIPFIAFHMVPQKRWVTLCVAFSFLGGASSALVHSRINDPSLLIQAPFQEINVNGNDRQRITRNTALPQYINNLILPDNRFHELVDLKNELDNLLNPGETYLDLTNHSARYYFLDLPVPLLEAAIYNAPSPEMQKRMLAKSGADLPPVVLCWGDNILHDGGPVSLRNNLVYRKIALEYSPIKRGRFIFLVRHDRAQSLPIFPFHDKVPLATARDGNSWKMLLCDNNNYQGIQVGDPIHLLGVTTGDTIIFPNGLSSRITRIEGSNVWFNGSPIDRNLLSTWETVVICRQVIPSQDNGLDTMTKRILLAKSFTAEHLQKIPVAWGRSWNSLAPRTISRGRVAETHRDGEVPNQQGKITLSLPTKDIHLNGRDTSLLKMDFSCASENIKAQQELVLRWITTSAGVRDLDMNSIKFTAENGTLLIPLDSNPSWLFTENPEKILLSTAGGKSCADIKVTDIEFFDRI